MEVCPYLEETFKVIVRSWNGLILNYLSRCDERSAHFSDMKRDLRRITPRALSLKLTELSNIYSHLSEVTIQKVDNGGINCLKSIKQKLKMKQNLPLVYGPL